MNKEKRDLKEAQNRAERAKNFKINPTANYDYALSEKEMA